MNTKEEKTNRKVIPDRFNSSYFQVQKKKGSEINRPIFPSLRSTHTRFGREPFKIPNGNFISTTTINRKNSSCQNVWGKLENIYSAHHCTHCCCTLLRLIYDRERWHCWFICVLTIFIRESYEATTTKWKNYNVLSSNSSTTR